MKFKIIIALILFLLCASSLVDWIVFSVKNSNLKFDLLKEKYINRFPPSIREFYSNNIRLTTIFFIAGFVISGIILIQQKSKFLKAIGIVSFMLSAWELFSLM